MIHIPSRKGVVIRHRRRRVLVTVLGAVVVAWLPSASGQVQSLSERARSETFDYWRPTRLDWLEPAPLDPDVAERLFTTYDTGRYADFDRLADTLASSVINPFEFEADAERWMEAAADRRRRAVVAAAVALELASRSSRQEPTAVELRFTLAELGCTWLRDHPPSPEERSWHAAFVALARATRREDFVISFMDPRLGRARLAGWPQGDRDSWRGIASQSDRERRQHQVASRKAREGVLARLRRESTRSRRFTRIDLSPPLNPVALLLALYGGEHGWHVLARFPDDPHRLFIEALVLERQMTPAHGVPDPLPDRPLATPLDEGRHGVVWLDAAAVDGIAAGGARQVRAVPMNRRMDRPSAERLLQVVPELEQSTFLRAVPASAPFTSLMLWDIVDAFRAVPVREPVAAEAALRLGQNYTRLARPDLALPAFARAESLATTPYELYLARLLAGAVFARTGHRTEAIMAMRGALVAAPRAQSASFALAPLLVQVDAQEDAAEILEAAMALPLVDDPLHAYYEGDPTALPRALARLREEAAR